MDTLGTPSGQVALLHDALFEEIFFFKDCTGQNLLGVNTASIGGEGPRRNRLKAWLSPAGSPANTDTLKAEMDERWTRGLQ